MHLPPNPHCPYIYTIYTVEGGFEKVVKIDEATLQVIACITVPKNECGYSIAMSMKFEDMNPNKNINVKTTQKPIEKNNCLNRLFHCMSKNL